MISSEPSLHLPSMPLKSWIPRIPNTKRKSMTISNTLMSAGIDSRRAFTTVLIPNKN